MNMEYCLETSTSDQTRPFFFLFLADPYLISLIQEMIRDSKRTSNLYHKIKLRENALHVRLQNKRCL